MDLRVAGRWRIGHKLGSGSFGDIYHGHDMKTNEAVAIKLEPHGCKYPQLLYEARVYKLLQHKGEEQKKTAPAGLVFRDGVPHVHYVGVEGDFNVLIMDLCGPSLEDLFGYCGRQFTLKTTLQLAEQLIERIEWLHQASIIHRDIKPDNFLMGNHHNPAHVYSIDFGLSKRYRDPHTGAHIPFKDGKSMTGTARYASIWTHLGHEQSRRDDLESIGYVLMYFLRGSLPWQGLRPVGRPEKYDQIADVKQKTPVEDLCWGHPAAFENYLRYVKDLAFDEQPDYRRCQQWFGELFVAQGFQRDGLFDWNLRRAQEREVERRRHGAPSERSIGTSQHVCCPSSPRDGAAH